MAPWIGFGLLSISGTVAYEFTIPLFLREIWPPAHHDPRRPPTTICRPASKSRSQRRSHRARTGSDGWGFPAAHAQCLAWKAHLFAPDHRRHHAPPPSGCARSDRTGRMAESGRTLTETCGIRANEGAICEIESGGLPSCGDPEIRRKFQAVE